MTAAAPRVLMLSYGALPDAPGHRFEWLGKMCSGDLVAPASREQSPHSPAAVFGALRCHGYQPAQGRLPWHATLDIIRCIRLGRRLAREGAFDIVIACGLYRTTIAGVVLARLLGARLLVEVPVLPRQIVRYRDASSTWQKRLKAWWLGAWSVWLLRRADHIKWIFPGHAEAISPKLAACHASAFVDFVAVDRIDVDSNEDGAIVLLGTPLYLKGADLAIAAFQKVLPRHPGRRLRIIGSSRGFAPLRASIAPADPIELVDYLPHAQAIVALQQAVLVLIPSRTDAMPRVAIEAMAAGKALIAAAVDGMSRCLRDGENCLLVPPVDVDALADAIDRLLSDVELRRRLGARARHDAVTHFSEHSYATRYRRMLDDCLADVPGESFGPAG